MSEPGENKQRGLFRGLERVSDVGTIDYRAVRRNKCVTPIPRGVPASSLSSVILARASNEAFGAATQFLKPFNPFPLAMSDNNIDVHEARLSSSRSRIPPRCEQSRVFRR